jgi:hypothetical protein
MINLLGFIASYSPWESPSNNWGRVKTLSKIKIRAETLHCECDACVYLTILSYVHLIKRASDENEPLWMYSCTPMVCIFFFTAILQKDAMLHVTVCILPKDVVPLIIVWK